MDVSGKHPIRALGWLCLLLGFGASASGGGFAKSAPTTPFILPVRAACVSSPFGPRFSLQRPLLNAFHNGVDLPSPVGAPVMAVAPGVVIRVQRKGPGGLEMLIQHPGFIGVYSHLGLVAPAIANGLATVYGGERIGTVGLSGLVFGPHLFFAMIVGDQAVDPAGYLHLASCGVGKAAAPVDGRVRPTRVYSLH